MSGYTPNLNLFKYDVDTDGKEVFSITKALNHNWDILDNLGSGRNVGEIIASTLPLEDAGLHLLDGALVDGSGIYSEFVQYIANLYSNNPTAKYFTTESDWQSSVTTYGVCGKFVYDSENNTVRLPKYNSKIYSGEGTAPVVGNGMTLGLMSNSTLNQFYGLSSGYQGNTQGGFVSINYGVPAGSTYSANNSYNPNFYQSLGVTTDSTKSGLIVALADITTSLDGYYYIVLATSTKTDIQVDLDNVTTEINNMVSKNDLAEVQCVIETYENGTSWYRVWSDGWCEQGGRITSGGGNSTIYLLRSFKNNNYTILYSQGGTDSDADGNADTIRTDSLTINSFIVNRYVSSATAYWQANGYIEV